MTIAPPHRRRPIGVFDSGVGGLTVVRALRAALPAEDIVYLGDTARVPYGTKSPRTVERYATACLRFLLEKDVGLVVIACNTASATALPALEAASPVPVIGAVGPGASAAAEASAAGHIGVIGTLATVRSGAYERALRGLRADVVVTAQACPLFVPLAEEGWTDDDIAMAAARRYLGALARADPAVDTLVLGCTHYPLLKRTIAAAGVEIFGRPLTIVDSAAAMASVASAAARPAGAAAPDAGAATGSLRCFATDASRLDELAPRFLGLTGAEGAGAAPTGGPAVVFDLVDLAI